MYYQLRILVCWIIGIAYAFGMFPSSALGQSLLSTSPVANKTVGDPFAIGKTLLKTNTLDYIKQDDLIAKVGGKPSMEAFNKYGGDFDKYYKALGPDRKVGKDFEAMSVFNKNKKLARSGSSRRFLVTAAEGYPKHPADVVEINIKTKKVTGRIQNKFTWETGQDALFDSNYAGMKIVIPKDQMKILKQNLKAELNALQRNLVLNHKWQSTKEAILDGRIIPDSLSSNGTMANSKRNTKAEWEKLTYKIEAMSTPNVVKSSSATAGSKALGKTLAKGFIVIDIAGSGYQTYEDWGRYNSQEISGGFLAAKVTMRGSQLALAGYLLTTPEPIATKIAFAGVMVLIAADAISDTIHEKRQEHAKHILETIDRDERFHSARQQLLQ